MKKLLSILVLSLLLSGSGYAEIVFRADCENPKGVRFSESIAHLKNDELISSYYEKDQFTGNDIIELIYDNSNPKQIQNLMKMVLFGVGIIDFFVNKKN